jgi:opacity protein-like surface antigen
MIRVFALPAAIVIAAAAGAGSVSAQDWTGGYVGGQVGSLNADTTATGSDNEPTYGLHAGYLGELGNGLVLGAEFEYDWTDLDLGAATIDSVGRAKAIIGWDAGPAMPYAVVGAARVDTSIGSGNGWVAGAGLAYEVTSNIRVSGELLYHEFDDLGATTIDADATSANLRVSYRF